MSNGKGDKPRPKTVNYKTWEKNWNKIFRKNNDKSKSKK
jgi:uncharacterized membrane protein